LFALICRAGKTIVAQDTVKSRGSFSMLAKLFAVAAGCTFAVVDAGAVPA
jgi:hypothetical protein